MKSFGIYIRKIREERDLPLRKVAAALDIDTSILSKIERNERAATKEMIPILAEILERPEKEIEIEDKPKTKEEMRNARLNFFQRK